MKRAKKKIFILAIVVVIVVGAVLILNRETITSEQSSDDNNSITYINLNKDYDDIEDIYLKLTIGSLSESLYKNLNF